MSVCPTLADSAFHVPVAEACYANDFGCSLEQLGLGEMITENQRWDSGALPITKMPCMVQYLWGIGTGVAAGQRHGGVAACRGDLLDPGPPSACCD